MPAYCSRRPVGGARAKSKPRRRPSFAPGSCYGRALPRPDDLAQLLDRGGLGFRGIVVTPRDDLQHLRADVAFAALHYFDPAGCGPIFLIEHARRRRSAVPITIEDVKGLAGIFENVGANGKRNAVHGEQFVLDAAALRHAARGEANVGPMIFNEEPGGAARKPFEKIHAPVMAVSEPVASAAFVITEQSLGSFVDLHFLPVRGFSRPGDGPGSELSRARFVGTIPNLGANFGDHSQGKQEGESKTWDSKGGAHLRRWRSVLLFARENPAQAPQA